MIRSGLVGSAAMAWQKKMIAKKCSAGIQSAKMPAWLLLGNDRIWQ
jgi:hypothetical protein